MNWQSNLFNHTKIQQPPIRNDIVARERLYEYLTAGLNKRFTLITAPAGYGKTTLVNAWLSQINYPVAWLTLDSHDNDPVRFFSYLLAALSSANLNRDETLSTEEASSLRSRIEAYSSDLDPSEMLLNDVLSEITKQEPFTILVLDDFHLISNPTVYDAVEFLLQNLPYPDQFLRDGGTGCHMVITSRASPAFPVARWRLHGKLAEINTDDLRMSLDEADYLVNHIKGMDLSPENVSSLTACTEGWVAGLELAILSLKGQKNCSQDQFIDQFKGSNRMIADFMIEEVLFQQPSEIQDFLLQTSILDRMCSDLCGAVTLKPDSQAVLENLERTNGFVVPLDHARNWYRYHQLFSDVLVSRLKNHHPDLYQEVHRRAAVWLTDQGELENSLQHWFAAGEHERAAQLVINNASYYLDLGEFYTLRCLIESFPLWCFEAYPWLSIRRAAMCSDVQPEHTENWLITAEHAISNAQEEEIYTEEELNDMRATIATTRSLNSLIIGDLQGVKQYANEALALLSADKKNAGAPAMIALSQVYFQENQLEKALKNLVDAKSIFKKERVLSALADINSWLGCILSIRGSLHEAAQTFQESITLNEQQSNRDIYFSSRAYSGLGSIQYEWNNLEEAQANLTQGYMISERMGISNRIASAVPLARYYLTLGDLSSAAAVLQEFPPFTRISNVMPWYASELVAVWLHYLALNNDVQGVHRLAAEFDLHPDAKFTPLREPEGMAYALANYLLGDLKTAVKTAANLEQSMAKGDRNDRWVRSLVLQAAALKQLGDPDALEVLARAIGLSAKEGYIRTYLEFGDVMCQLITELSTSSLVDQLGLDQLYIGELISASMETGQIDHLKKRQEIMLGLVKESLSEREIQVLQLIMGELSNAEIADELGISINTVKSHIANLYRKFDVHSRLEISNRARQIGLK